MLLQTQLLYRLPQSDENDEISHNGDRERTLLSDFEMRYDNQTIMLRDNPVRDLLSSKYSAEKFFIQRDCLVAKINLNTKNDHRFDFGNR